MWILGKEVQWNPEGEYYVERGIFTGIVSRNRLPDNLPENKAFTWVLMLGRIQILDRGFTTGPGPAVDALNERAKQVLNETELMK